MRLQKIILINRAPFEHLELNFDNENLGVLSGINGSGKTTIISYIVDSFYELAKSVFTQEFKDRANDFYRISSRIYSIDIEKVSEELVRECKIVKGSYDIVSKAEGNIPTYWEIGRVYQRLIKMVNNNTSEYINTTIVVLSSWIIEKIDNYNSSMYYENPDYIYNCYKEGRVL